MYVRKTLVGQNPTLETSEKVNPFCDCLRIARPMSYYINGGVDTEGLTDRLPPPAHFDDADAISDGTVDVATDARVSRLDIVAMASEMATDAASRASKQITDLDPQGGQ